MNKNAFLKLNIEKLQYYDFTDGRVAIIPRAELEKTLKKSYWHGVNSGSLGGTIGITISSLIPLATVRAESFNKFLGIDGPTWQAILILISVISLVIFIILLVKALFSFWKGDLKESKVIDVFFHADRKVGRKRLTKKDNKKNGI